MTQTVLLGDICTKITDGAHWSPKSTDDGYPMASVKDMLDNRINIETCRKISEEDYRKLVNDGCRPEKNDVLIAKDGSYLKHMFVSDGVDDVVLLSSIAILRPDTTLVDPRFLAYYIRNQRDNYDLSQYVSGAAIPRIILKNFARMPINLPDLDTQKKIADVLGMIDEKIELNRKMNETLEQMGQALFRHYFIDNPEAEGWQEAKVSDLLEFIGGSQPPKSEHIYEKKAGYIRFVQNRDYSSNNHHTYIPVAKRNKVCNETDIMMDKYGEAGQVRFGIPGAYNVALAKIVPKQPNTQEYLRSYFSIPQIQKSLEGAAAASTRSSLNATTFAGLKINMPTSKLLVQFEDEQKTRLRMIMRNDHQIQTLIALRDTLLPRLINGKVKLD